MMGFSFASLRARLVLLVLLAVVPALGLILYTAAEQRRSAIVEAQENALRLARSISSSQDDLVEGVRHLLTVLSRLPVVQRGDAVGCNRLFADLLKQYQRYHNFIVAKPNGDVFCSAVPLAQPVNLADRPNFQAAVQTDGFAVGDYVIARTTGKAILGFSHPVLDPKGRLKAVVFASFDLTWLNQSIAKTQLPSGATLSVFDRKGTVLVRHPDPEKWIGQTVSEIPLAKTVLAQREGVAEAAGMDGIPRLFGFTPLGSGTPGAYVTVGVPKDLAIAAANRILVRNLIALGIVALFALVAAWFGAGVFVLRRVNKLVAATKRLSAGDLNVRTGLPYGEGELGQLACAFDEMASALETQRAESERAEAERKQAEGELASINQRLERSLGELGSLYAVLTPVDLSGSINQMMERVIERLIEATGADAALIRMYDKMTGSFICASQRGFLAYYLERVLTPPPGSALDYVFSSGEPIISADIAADPRLKGKLQLQAGFRSCAFLPLRAGREMRGIVHLASREMGYFREEKKEHLMAIARQMGIAIENRELFDEISAARVELEKASKVKDEFLRFVSHELRTPINAVLGYAAMIQDGLYGEVHGEQRETLGKIMSRSHDLLSMVNALLEATRIEAGVVRLERNEVNLSEFLGEVRSTYDVRLDKEITLIWNYPSDIPTLETDKDKLRHILQNLINNAIKYTDKGSVTVSAKIGQQAGGSRQPASRLTPSRVEFKVSDTGIGIPKESLTAVFEMFRQVKGSRSGSRGGVGLGLHIVKKFTELIGGEIEVESAPGKGSTFTVTIPCESDPSAVNVQRSVVYSGKSV